MVKPPSFDSNGMKKGAWSEEEDNKLRAYVLRYGHWNWRLLPKYAGLTRCGKSCRLRWVNYLKPGVKRGKFSKEEENLIIKLHSQLGNKWSAIAAKLPGRTDNEVKNYYHTRIEKKKKIEGHAACEASSKGRVLERDMKAFELAQYQKFRDESASSETTCQNKLQESTLSQLDTCNNTSPHQTTQSEVDLLADIFQPDTNYNQINDSFPPLMEEDFFFPELHYSELSSSDSSYMSSLDWIADDEHSIISSKFAAPSIQGSFWGESSALSYTSDHQNDQERSTQEVGAFNYDSLFQCFDYGMGLFS